MNISIRESILSNFKNSNEQEIKESIQEAIEDDSEIALPGLGVFFELLWKCSEENEREKILEILKKNL